jgi:hypothetical protein
LVITSLVICGHGDVKEVYCTIGWAMFLKEQ